MIAAIILAAGQSRRMGGVNKLLMDVEGAPMVAHVARAVCESAAQDVIVVLGHEAERIKAALHAYPVRFVHNVNYARGMGASLACGVRALSKSCTGALVCLGDMPFVRGVHIDTLIEAFGAAQIVAPVSEDGRRGHPVLLGRRFFDALKMLDDDMGARAIIAAHEDVLHLVRFDDDACFVDIDK